jgi:methylated-DNA-protein-cysteine methyltransferase-like protein
MSQMSFYDKVIATVKSIPKGKVMTYGQVAAAAGNPKTARFVSGAMRRYPDSDLPWHRVLNGQGYISLPTYEGYELQKSLLIMEGVVLNEKDRVDLNLYAFKGPFFSIVDPEDDLPLK